MIKALQIEMTLRMREIQRWRYKAWRWRYSILLGTLLAFILFYRWQFIVKPIIVDLVNIPGDKSPKVVVKSTFKANNESQSNRCILPQLRLHTPEIDALHQKLLPLDCTDVPDWVFVDEKLVLQYTEYASKNLDTSKVTCNVKYIYRETEDSSTYEYIENVPIGKYIIKHDIFVIDCDTSLFNTWSRPFLKFVEQQRFRKPAAPQKLDVVMIGIDSVSRVEFQRSLPLTYEYLINSMGAVVLNGHNIVGDGTPQAYIPMLTGQTETELPLTRKRYPEANFVDDVYPFIWKNFSNAGYVTAYGEDVHEVETYSYRLKGFRKAPADHYIRPFFREIEKVIGFRKELCIGAELLHDIWFGYISDFMAGYKSTSKFLLLHQNRYSHDGNTLGLEDAAFAKFLKESEEKRLFENAVLMVFADHGARFTGLRQTAQGSLEERLPFFSIRLPEAMKRKMPMAFENLKLNSQRLTTPFDLYSTLSDILKFESLIESDFNSVPMPLPRSMSLLRRVPENRNCEKASIEPHWCACIAWHSILGTPLATELAIAIVNQFNAFLRDESDICAKLELSKIVEAEQYAPDKGVLQYAGAADADGFIASFSESKKTDDYISHRLVFETVPKNARYMVTVQFNSATRHLVLDANAISHVNKYGDLPHCIISRNYFRGLFCVCKDRI
uniref:DUF229 domain-containing protein n=1 Tax=Panagrellus redivivus TaxID=6233 RepID=A0A7E5A260_PANRE